MKIFSLYSIVVCIAELVQQVQPDVVSPEYEACVRNCCTYFTFEMIQALNFCKVMKPDTCIKVQTY